MLGRGSTVSLYCTGIMRSHSSRGTKRFQTISLPWLSSKYEMICIVQAAVIRGNYPRKLQRKTVAKQVLRQIHQDLG